MLVRRQLSVGGETVHRGLLEDGVVVVDVVQNRRRRNEKPTIHPTAAALRFLRETGPVAIIEIQRSIAAGWLDGRDGRDGARLVMEVDDFPYVQISDTITVCERKSLVADVFLGAQ